MVHAPEHVCCRYRLRAFAPYLALAGWKLHPLAIGRGPWGFLQELRQAAAAQVVVLQRKLLPRWHLGLLRQVAKVLIYDFDNAVYLRDSNAGRGTASVWRSGPLRRHDPCGRRRPGRQSIPRRTGVGLDRGRPYPALSDLYRPRSLSPRDSRSPRRGGSPGLDRQPQHGLVARHGPPGLAGRRGPLAGTAIEGDLRSFSGMPGIEVIPRDWSSDSETRESADADIGISWLPDHPWSLGKCGLKVLQYMAAGLPVVANPVGIHRQLVCHGRTGFLATSPAHWAEAIHRLASSPEAPHADGPRGAAGGPRAVRSGPLVATMDVAAGASRRRRPGMPRKPGSGRGPAQRGPAAHDQPAAAVTE